MGTSKLSPKMRWDSTFGGLKSLLSFNVLYFTSWEEHFLEWHYSTIAAQTFSHKAWDFFIAAMGMIYVVKFLLFRATLGVLCWLAMCFVLLTICSRNHASLLRAGRVNSHVHHQYYKVEGHILLVAQLFSVSCVAMSTGAPCLVDWMVYPIIPLQRIVSDEVKASAMSLVTLIEMIIWATTYCLLDPDGLRKQGKMLPVLAIYALLYMVAVMWSTTNESRRRMEYMRRQGWTPCPSAFVDPKVHRGWAFPILSTEKAMIVTVLSMVLAYCLADMVSDPLQPGRISAGVVFLAAAGRALLGYARGGSWGSGAAYGIGCDAAVQCSIGGAHDQAQRRASAKVPRGPGAGVEVVRAEELPFEYQRPLCAPLPRAPARSQHVQLGVQRHGMTDNLDTLYKQSMVDFADAELLADSPKPGIAVRASIDLQSVAAQTQKRPKQQQQQQQQAAGAAAAAAAALAPQQPVAAAQTSQPSSPSGRQAPSVVLPGTLHLVPHVRSSQDTGHDLIQLCQDTQLLQSSLLEVNSSLHNLGLHLHTLKSDMAYTAANDMRGLFQPTDLSAGDNQGAAPGPRDALSRGPGMQPPPAGAGGFLHVNEEEDEEDEEEDEDEEEEDGMDSDDESTISTPSVDGSHWSLPTTCSWASEGSPAHPSLLLARP